MLWNKNMLFKFLVSIFAISLTVSTQVTTRKSEEYTWDENGYIIFCLCMGKRLLFVFSVRKNKYIV